MQIKAGTYLPGISWPMRPGSDKTYLSNNQ